jgi:hypothetical protein
VAVADCIVISRYSDGRTEINNDEQSLYTGAPAGDRTAYFKIKKSHRSSVTFGSTALRNPHCTQIQGDRKVAHITLSNYILLV